MDKEERVVKLSYTALIIVIGAATLDGDYVVYCVCVMLSCVWLLATPWTVARQTPLSMEFSRYSYWSGLPFASPRGFPNPRIELESPTLQADSLPSEPQGKLFTRAEQIHIHWSTDSFPNWDAK